MVGEFSDENVARWPCMARLGACSNDGFFGRKSLQEHEFGRRAATSIGGDAADGKIYLGAQNATRTGARGAAARMRDEGAGRKKAQKAQKRIVSGVQCSVFSHLGALGQRDVILEHNDTVLDPTANEHAVIFGRVDEKYRSVGRPLGWSSGFSRQKKDRLKRNANQKDRLKAELQPEGPPEGGTPTSRTA